MNKIYPYIREDNCSNLPYCLKKDVKGNDIIVVNNEEILLNEENTDLDYQITIFNNYVVGNKYISYILAPKIYLLYEYNEINNKKIGNIKIIDNGRINSICEFVNDDEYVYTHISNDIYVAIIKYDSEYYSKEIIDGYDLINHQVIDCDNVKTNQSLLYNLVNRKRCRFDVIVSIITGKINNNKNRLLDVLSFLLGYKVNDSNYDISLLLAKDYILYNYPELKHICLDSIDIKEKSIDYGLSYFSFNPINHSIKDIKYKNKQKKLCKAPNY